MILQNYTRRAQIGIASATTIQFAASALTRRPIILAKDGRVAVLTAPPTALTISGTAGTRYVYADLAAPSGTAWYGANGLLDLLLQMLALNRLKLVTAFRMLFPDDQSLAYAAQNSVATFVESATAPATETTAGRIPLGQFECAGGVITSLTSYEGEISVTVSAFIHGQAILKKVSTNIVLLPYNGASLVISGVARSVPSGGVTPLAATGLTPGTQYYIYAAWNGSAIAIEASTTGHATHTDGVEIKSGDSTRTYVGSANVLTGPVWGTVLTWFNVPQPRYLSRQAINVGTPANTTETVLATYQTPAGLLDTNGQALRVKAVWQLAANGNNKTYRIRFPGIGGTVLASEQSSSSNEEVSIDATIQRTGASTSDARTVLVHRGATSENFTQPTVTWANANDIVATGQNGSASANDLRCRSFEVEFKPEPVG